MSDAVMLISPFIRLDLQYFPITYITYIIYYVNIARPTPLRSEYISDCNKLSGSSCCYASSLMP